MTPLQIKIALHYYTTAAPYAEYDLPTVVLNCIDELVRAGMLIPESNSLSGYLATDGLRVYVDKLMSIPLPKSITSWVF
jgi:hypothetical protein